MFCSSCHKTPCTCASTCNNCATTTVYLTTCSGCLETHNTNCIIYNGDVLSFEPATAVPYSNRTLTQLLQLIGGGNCGGRESKIIKFHSDGVTDDGSSYTLVAEDVCKVLLVTVTDEGVVGNITSTIVLPNTADFIDKEIIIKDISTTFEDATHVIQFNQAIQYDWNPVTTTALFANLESSHKVVRLRLIKVNELSYQWIVVD